MLSLQIPGSEILDFADPELHPCESVSRIRVDFDIFLVQLDGLIRRSSIKPCFSFSN